MRAPVCLAVLLPWAAAAADFRFPEAQTLLRNRCLGCHTGKAGAGGFDLARFKTQDSLATDPRAWNRVVARVRNGEMPPQNAPALTIDERKALTGWVESTLHAAACSDGIQPLRAPFRRLNRAEYAASVRDLFNIHINAGHALPADGAGGEGFDNAAETLFLSPIHAEKYLDAAKQALEYALSEPRARVRFLIAEPGPELNAEAAARKVLAAFLPRAFRRPVRGAEIDPYLTLFQAAQKRGDSYDASIAFALQGVLVSPQFLFRVEPRPTQPGIQLVDHYSMASRLSYFLWGTMPDAELFDLAANSLLHDPNVLDNQVARMLRDQKSVEFAEAFVEQWLGTRELGRDIKPDAKLFPEFYEDEVRSGMRYEPILFFREVLMNNEPLTHLLDADYTVASNKLARFYGFDSKGIRQQPVRFALPEGHRRGGLLGMSAILAVSSLPHRTSPVLRGKWVLNSILGTPPPPPPPNVPELKEEAHAGEAPKTLRERLMQHRQNPACASCHKTIDPVGFGLENYDVIGRWREQDAGKPIDAKGELPDGTVFNGPAELKKTLLAQKDVFLRNLTSKMLGYALGRGLTLEDSCTVDAIVAKLNQNEVRAQTLVAEIVRSVPFRYRPGAPPDRKTPTQPAPKAQSQKEQTR